jgi:hypothetical protein
MTSCIFFLIDFTDCVPVKKYFKIKEVSKPAELINNKPSQQQQQQHKLFQLQQQKQQQSVNIGSNRTRMTSNRENIVIKVFIIFLIKAFLLYNLFCLFIKKINDVKTSQPPPSNNPATKYSSYIQNNLKNSYNYSNSEHTKNGDMTDADEELTCNTNSNFTNTNNIDGGEDTEDSFASPVFNENFLDLIRDVKRRQTQKTLHQQQQQLKASQQQQLQNDIIGSILEAVPPSETDAFSEYSTFVNNIFNKALEK